MSEIVLRDYQEKVKKDIINFIENSKATKGIITMPVGTGKSIIPAIIAQYVKGKVLVIQPSKELLEQNYNKALSFGIKPAIYSASLGQKNIDRVTYATPMSVVKVSDEFKDVDVVVIDEAHLHSTKINPAHDSRLSSFLKRIRPKKIIGLTATPIQLVNGERGSELKMITRSRKSFWQGAEMIHLTQIQDICKKYWADISYQKYDVDESCLMLNSTGSDFVQESIVEMFEENNLYEEILKIYEELIKKGKKHILVFVPSVDIAQQLERMNKSFKAIWGNMNDCDRELILKGFRNGEIKCVINVNVLTTGFDFPELDTIIMARSTNSFSLYHQMAGRLVRPIVKDGRVYYKKGIMVDLTNNTQRFGILEEITYEKRDYTKGWGMWSGDRLLTGVPTNGRLVFTRQQVYESYNREMKKLMDKPKVKSVPKTDIEQRAVKNKFSFGKYKGFSIMEIYNRDKGYLQWLMDSKKFKPINKKIIEFVQIVEAFYIFKATRGGSK